MSFKALIGLIVALVVIGGGVWYYANNAGTTMPDGSSNTGGEERTGPTGSGTLKSLFGMSGSFKCTIFSGTAQGTGDGTVYISNGNMRGDFTVQTAGRTMTMSMVKSGDYMYNWSDAMPQGMKMKASVMEGDTSADASTQGIDPNVAVNYSCEPTSVNPDMFVPPTNIEFIDLSEGIPGMPADMMKNLPKGMPGVQ